MNAFASLSIKRAAILEKEKDRYLVISKKGEKKIVTADSAAEAVEVSEFKDIKRVANLAYEAEEILEKGGLTSMDETFETRITFEEELSEFHTADLLGEEQEGEAFVECDLLEFASLSHLESPATKAALFVPEPDPLPQPKPEPAEAVAAAEELPTEPFQAEAVAKAVEVIDAPVEHPLQPLDKQLTEEEVEALLKPE